MPSKKNIAEVQYLTDRLTRSKSVVLADYKGLTVAQITDLRNKIKDQAGEFKVTKNTLLKLAFKAANFPLGDVESQLTGPSAIIFGLAEELASIKTTFEFAKDNSLPKFKAGFLGQEYLSAAKLLELAKLPPREILLATVVGTLNAPLVGIVNVLQGNLRKLVFVLKAIEKSKN